MAEYPSKLVATHRRPERARATGSLLQSAIIFNLVACYDATLSAVLSKHTSGTAVLLQAHNWQSQHHADGTTVWHVERQACI